MARYRIYVAGAAQKELKKLGPAAAREVVAHVWNRLGENPLAAGRPLTGDLAGYYRLRIAGYRVVYRVAEEKVWVLVLAAGKREEGNVDDIYQRLTGDQLTKRLARLLAEIERDEAEENG